MGGSFWKILLVVGTVLEAGTSATLKEPLSYEEAVGLGVDLYNKGPGKETPSKLLKAVPPPQWDPSSDLKQTLNFTIKETTCQAKDQPAVGKCDFKENGTARECVAYYNHKDTPPVTIPTCKEVKLTPRTRRLAGSEKKVPADAKKDKVKAAASAGKAIVKTAVSAGKKVTNKLGDLAVAAVA